MAPVLPRGGLSTQSGTTLIEVMASSVILGMTFIAVVTMVQKARDIEFEGNTYNQAHAIVTSILERSAYHYSNYAAITAPDNVTFSDEATPEIHPSYLFYIDPLMRLVTTVTDVTPAEWGGQTIQYKRFQVILTWGATDTVRVYKRIAL